MTNKSYILKMVPDISIGDINILLQELEIVKLDLSQSGTYVMASKLAVGLMDIDTPYWDKIASKLLLGGVKQEIHNKLNGQVSILNMVNMSESYIPDLLDGYNVELLEKAIDNKRDDLFTYLGAVTLLSKYSVRNSEGVIVETPQMSFMRVAIFLARNEKDKTNKAIEFYTILSKFEFMTATPTLANAGTTRHQLFSCFVASVPDNIEGIFNSFKEFGLFNKFGGGVGSDWSVIRGMGSEIDGKKGIASGVIPQLKITNDIAIAVDQLGVRKGAIAANLAIWHSDIIQFLELKKNSGEERRRAHDIFPTVWLDDVFIERVKNNETYSLFDPVDTPELVTLYDDEFRKKYLEYENDPNINRTTMNAKEVWKSILISYVETGTPFLGFKDEANRRNQNSNSGVIRSTNLCTEIFQNTSPDTETVKINFIDDTYIILSPDEMVTTIKDIKIRASKITSETKLKGLPKITTTSKEIELGETAVCCLGSINMSKVNTKEKIDKTVKTAMRMLDNAINLNLYPTDKTYKTSMKNRSVGLGLMGETNMLALKGIHFGTKEHYNLIDEYMENFSLSTIEASMDLSDERGSYSNFNESNWAKGIIPIDTENKNAVGLTNRERDKDRIKRVKERVKLGVRNGYMMSIAPTSSISILTGTSQSIEPIYKRKWFEENLGGLVPALAPNLTTDTYQYYTPAVEIDQIKLIEAAAVRQRWIDQGQSLNIFVTPKVTGKMLNEIYMTGHKYGLKSTYYLRSESPDSDNVVVDRSIECNGCQ